jgi:hypothetical protein
LLYSTYLGWRIPTFNEVESLFRGIDARMPAAGDGINRLEGTYTSQHMVDLFSKTSRYISSRNTQYFSQALHTSLDGNSARLGNFAYDINGSPGGNVMHYNNPTSNLAYKNASYGVFIVSDGGTTLSSINDPSLNAMNDNAPVNNVPLPATAALLGLGLLGFGARRMNNG